MNDKNKENYNKRFFLNWEVAYGAVNTTLPKAFVASF